ncbi:hypothetical protein BH11CYA1_BH11CYA1_04680 [soil metagenome]
MDIFLVLMLLFAAWLGGHALDFCFSRVEKAICPESESEPAEIYGSRNPTEKSYKRRGVQAARLYLVPSAIARHQ